MYCRPVPRSLRSRTIRTRSEEHTSELQSLMRNSYVVFCLKKKKKNNKTNTHIQYIEINRLETISTISRKKQRYQTSAYKCNIIKIIMKILTNIQHHNI